MLDRIIAAYQEFGLRIRRRIIWTILAFGVGAAFTWYYNVDIFHFLLVPAGSSLSPFEGGVPVFTAPTGMWGATIHLAVAGGKVAALPVAVMGGLTLASPAIPQRRRRFIYVFTFVTLLCFVGGAAFAYYVMMPAGLKFLLNFGNDVAIPLISINEYINLLFAMVLWLGVVFELPLAMFLLAKMRIFPYQKFRRLRKFVPVTAFILAAILTPTFDAVNLTMMAVPIIVLYEVGLFLAWAAHPEMGNYMFLKTAWSAVTSPARAVRWAYRKVRRR